MTRRSCLVREPRGGGAGNEQLCHLEHHLLRGSGDLVRVRERPYRVNAIVAAIDSSPRTADAVPRAGTAELALTWAVYAAFAVAIVVTYARLDQSQLYHVSEGGIRGGLGRALVFLNFPTALAAVAVLLVAADRLPRLRIAAAVATALCAVTALPGVVDQADLDAKPVNVIPALGVAVAVVLTLVLVRSDGLGSLRRGVRDRVRVAGAVVLLVTGIPWLFAEVGFYADDVPGLATIFMSDELRREADGTTIRAVHLGEHHGTDGMLLALTAIVLSRLAASLRSPRLRIAFRAYIALMLVYGVANHAQDAWLEQIVKRGWSDVHLPDVVRPEASAAWAALLVAAAAVYLVLARNQPAPPRRLAPTKASTEGS